MSERLTKHEVSSADKSPEHVQSPLLLVLNQLLRHQKPRNIIDLFAGLKNFSQTEGRAEYFEKWLSKYGRETGSVVVLPGKIYGFGDMEKNLQLLRSENTQRSSLQAVPQMEELIGPALSGKSDSESYKQAIELLEEPLSMERVKAYVPTVQRIAEEHFQEWEERMGTADFDVVAETLDMFVVIVQQTLFGGREFEEFNPLSLRITGLLPYVTRYTLAELVLEDPKLPEKFRKGFFKFMVKDKEDYHQFKEEQASLTKEVEAFIKKYSNLPESELKTFGYLGVLLLKYKSGELSLPKARQSLEGFFIAAHDTTAAATGWIFQYFAKNPQLFEELKAEVRAAFPDGVIEHRKLAGLKVANGALLEVLRLHPPVEFFIREMTDYERFGDVVVPPKAMALGHLRHAYRDPEVFEEPDEFNPHRYKGRSDLTTFVHGAWAVGNEHVCKGMLLAKAEVLTVLASLALNYEKLEMSGPLAEEDHFGVLSPGPTQGFAMRR